MIRFVDSENNGRDDFLGFVTVEHIISESLATALLSWLETHNINVSFCRAQGYDRAHSMSSSIVDVQARIHSVSPMASYTHCQSHQLNLCIVKDCSIPQIRNAGGITSKIAKVLQLFPKAPALFSVYN